MSSQHFRILSTAYPFTLSFDFSNLQRNRLKKKTKYKLKSPKSYKQHKKWFHCSPFIEMEAQSNDVGKK